MKRSNTRIPPVKLYRMLLLAVVPNLSSNCFSLNSITQDRQGVTDYDLNGQRLTINLSQPLAPNSVTTFTLSFDLSLPPRSGEKPFGYLINQINLSDWYPFIVPYDNGWVLHIVICGIVNKPFAKRPGIVKHPSIVIRNNERIPIAQIDLINKIAKGFFSASWRKG